MNLYLSEGGRGVEGRGGGKAEYPEKTLDSQSVSQIRGESAPRTLTPSNSSDKVFSAVLFFTLLSQWDVFPMAKSGRFPQEKPVAT